MLPELFSIGPITIHSYGLMLAVAFLVAVWLFRGELRRWRLPEELADRIAIATMIGGIVGAKLYFLLLEAPEEFKTAPFSMIFSGAGLTFYGGLAGAVLLAVLVIRRAKVSVLHMADLVGPLVILGYGFGRIGCFLSGDGDYGPPTDLPWGMSFPHGTVPTNLTVHPTPLYEVALSWIGFAFLWFWLRRRPLPRGVMTGASFIVAGVERFVTEFWRLDSAVLVHAGYNAAFGLTEEEVAAFKAAVEAHYRYGGLSLAQWISLVLVLIGVLIIWSRRGRPAVPPPAEDARTGRAQAQRTRARPGSR